MSRRTIVILLFILLAVLAALIIWKWVYKKSDISVASKKAEVEIEAAALTHEFESDEDAANARYLGKIISVSGNVSSVTEAEQSLSVYLKNNEDMSGVMCTLSKNSVTTGQIKVGDKIKIKGYCDGYLMDVKLNKCSLEK
jgi:hypothetical protein